MRLGGNVERGLVDRVEAGLVQVLLLGVRFYLTHVALVEAYVQVVLAFLDMDGFLAVKVTVKMTVQTLP